MGKWKKHEGDDVVVQRGQLDRAQWGVKKGVGAGGGGGFSK